MTAFPYPTLAEVAGWVGLAAVAVVGFLGAFAVVDLVRRVAAVSGD